MFRHYLTLLLRNVRKNKIFSFINLFGLSAGVCSTLLIYLYVHQELSHDKFHKNANQIYRINQTFIWGENNDNQFSSTGPGVAQAISAEIPEVKAVTRIHTPGNFLISYKNKQENVFAYDEQSVLAADSNVFDIFSFELKQGKAKSALQNPYTIVLTESASLRYFANESPMGKVLKVKMGNEEKDFEVTGIVKDIPTTSYIKFDMMMSLNSFPNMKRNGYSWIWTTFETFALLDANTSPDVVREKLKLLPPKYADITLRKIMGTTFEEYTKNGKEWNLYLQPLTDIHLYSANIYNRLNDVGNIKIVYALGGAAIFILLLSCINFINLTTAQFTKRLKEVGIRKILGSNHKQLRSQYFFETFIFCLAALIIGAFIAQLLLPFLQTERNSFSDTGILTNPQVGLVLILLLVFISTFSGIYPALFLSRYNPMDAIRGKLKSGKKAQLFKNGLVVFQFATSIILIICTSVIFQQLNYFSKKDLGFDKEQLVTINRAEWLNNQESFIQALKKMPEISNASVNTGVPPNISGGDQFKPVGNSEKSVALNYTNIDEQYIPTLGLEVKQGRNFLKASPNDVNKVILNETAVKNLGWAADESVLGKKIFYPSLEQEFEVVGMVKDYNYWSLQAPVEALAMFHFKSEMFKDRDYIALKINPANIQQWDNTIANIQELWQSHAGDAPFQYEFVDQAFEISFKSEQNFGKSLSIFSTLALLIAALGLMGIMIYSLEQRTKEVGIRKVVGAKSWHILILISRSYIKLIALAVILGIPVAIYMMQTWLQDFEYRIKLSPIIFVLATLGTIIIAVLATSYHSIKTALLNPVDVLKDE